jgi:hypothetical protein
VEGRSGEAADSGAIWGGRPAPECSVVDLVGGGLVPG